MAVYPNKYNKKTNWREGEYVTAADMNKIEQGIYDSEVYTDEAIAALVSAKQGTSAPTTSTVGTIGQKYLNTTTKDLYECIGISGSSYTWKQIYKWVAADSKYYLVDADGDPIDVSALEAEIAEAATDVSELIAPTYDSTKHYKTGVLLTYESKLYEGIKDDIPVGTLPTNTTYFKEVSVDDVIKEIENGDREVATAKQAESIKSDRVIEDADVSCPPITFGTTGGDAEIQTGFNKFQYLYGKSKKWNQLAKTLNATNWLNSGTTTFSDGIATFAPTQQYDYIRCTVGNSMLGHQILISVKAKTGTIHNTKKLFFWGLGSANTFVPSLSFNFTKTNSWEEFAKIGTVPITATGNNLFGVQEDATSGFYSVQFKDFMLIDLTVIYGAGNEPTTVEEFKKDYPLAYYEYDKGTILSAKSSELVSVGENQWDEQWEVGSINFATGAKENSSTVIRSKNYIRVLGNTEYYFTLGDTSARMFVFAYDANYNYIGCYQGNNTWGTSYEDAQNIAIKMPENAEYLLFRCSQPYGTTYKNDISIYICWDTPGRPYVAHREDRITLPNIELRSAGSVRDVAYQTGGGKRYVGMVDLGTLDWAYNSYTFQSSEIASLIKAPSSTSIKANVECVRYATASHDTVTQGDKRISVYTSGAVFIRDTSYTSSAAIKTALSGVYLYYELATPTDIPTSENPGWTELVYTDNYGTLQFLTDPAQIPQVEQPYYIEYTVSLTDFLDSAYAHADGDVENLALKESVDDIVNGNTPAGKALLADNLESDNKIEDLLPYIMRQSPSGVAKSMVLDHITGATVAMNQPIQNGDFAQNTGWTGSYGTVSIANNICTYTVTTVGTANANRVEINEYKRFNITSGHKYFITAQVKTPKNQTVSLTSYSPSAGTSTINRVDQSATANTWTTIAQIVNAIATGTSDVRVGIHSASNTAVGDVSQVKNVMYIDLTLMFGSTIANYLYNQGTAGINKFRTLFPNPYYPYNAGQLVSVKTAGRKAIGINQWNQEWEVGDINATTGEDQVGTNIIRTKGYIPIIPGTSYYFYYGFKPYGSIRGRFYDHDKNYIGSAPADRSGVEANYVFVAPANAYYLRFTPPSGDGYGATYRNDICINISDPAINGTFYPYEADEYPCEEVELNGLFSLDSNNNIVAVNGDTYSNDGKVTRKYGAVDMGTLSYGSVTQSVFYAEVSGKKVASLKLVCSKYSTSIYTSGAAGADLQNKEISAGASNQYIYIKDTAYTDTATFKTAMSGVYLVYELADASQTEESASSFASTQKTGVTEQFMEPEIPSTVFLPVGHDSFYLPDLKEKLEVAPDSPTSDGTYLVSRSGGTNVYIPIANVTATQAEIDEIIAILE